MSGLGVLMYADGLLAYEGEFYDDKFHKFGKLKNKNAVSVDKIFDYRDFNFLNN